MTLVNLHQANTSQLMFLVNKLPYRAKRHYSIVSGEKNHLTFGVKRDVTTEHEGEVSTILHDEIKEGDMINLAAPVGGFVLRIDD